MWGAPMGRRSHYRVLTHDLPFVLRLLAPDRPPMPIRVDDLSIRGALIRLPSEEIPLQTGDIVRVEVVGITGSQLVIPARVVRASKADGASAYGIMFIEPAAIEARLTPELSRLFNRRRMPRFEPEALQALVSAPDTRWAVNVRDLSSDAVALDADAAPAPLRDEDPVSVRLRLPNEGEALDLTGVLRTRAAADGTRVIVHFDRDAANEGARARLLSYVGDRIRDES